MHGADLVGRYAARGNLTDRLAALRLLVHHGLDGAERRARQLPRALSRQPAGARQVVRGAGDRAEPCGARPRRGARRASGLLVQEPEPHLRADPLLRRVQPGRLQPADGAGYRFVAGVISDLDRQNPSVAARIATAFRSWRMLEPQRRGACRERRSRQMQQVGAAFARPRRHPRRARWRAETSDTAAARRDVNADRQFADATRMVDKRNSALIQMEVIRAAATPIARGGTAWRGRGGPWRRRSGAYPTSSASTARPSPVMPGSSSIPAYARLVNSEPYVKRLIPILIILFVVALGGDARRRALPGARRSARRAPSFSSSLIAKAVASELAAVARAALARPSRRKRCRGSSRMRCRRSPPTSAAQVLLMDPQGMVVADGPREPNDGRPLHRRDPRAEPAADDARRARRRAAARRLPTTRR